MKAIGSTIKLRVSEFTPTWMELNTKANGRKINNMGRVENAGPTEPSMRATTCWVRSMATVNSYGEMGQTIRAISTTITLRGKVNINGLTAGLTKASGYSTKCMDMAPFTGLTKESMKESI